MDVYGYIPDVISYSQLRHPYGGNNNQSANQNGWSLESTKDKRLRSNSAPKQGRSAGRSKDDCKDCPICQEKQRRPLAKYIRSKSVQDRCNASSISEDSEEILEEEEEEEEEEDAVRKETKTVQPAQKESAITSAKK